MKSPRGPLLICLALLAAAPGRGETASTQSADPPSPASTREAAPATRGPIPDAISDQTLELPGRTLSFNARVGFIRLFDNKGVAEADVNTTAYLLKGVDPAHRPVTFVLNGGPGMASAWLQMGAVGPWRVPMLAQPSADPATQPNAETWLDFTDLVFIDPVGTGYSRFIATDDETRKRLWSVDGDIDALSQAIRRWLDRNGRIGSPKYLLGESYGGFRGPRLALRLADHEGVGLRGMVLISPVLDFGNRSSALDLLSFAASLPTMAAAVREAHGQPVTRADLTDVETYASGAFLSDVLRGPSDHDATDRVIDRVSDITGIDKAIVRQRRGLIGSLVFLHEHDRAEHRIDSAYDASISSADPFPENPYGAVFDPIPSGMSAPLTEAVLSVYDRLHWHPEGPPYQLTSQDAGRLWDYGAGFFKPQSVGPLRQALALDSNLHVIVAHGLFDLVCPYYGSQLLINQIAPTAGADRVKLLTFPGGHMFYSRNESRAALRAEAAALMAAPP